MASTYSTNLRLELIGTGEQQGTWGSTTNKNLGTLLEQAICGYESVTVSDAGDTTLTASNGLSDQSRNMVLNLTGTISAARNVICPAIEKLYVVKNATSGGFSVTFKVSGQTGVVIPNGATVFLYVDGADARTITGSAATRDIGTSGATVPLLNGTNTWSASQSFSATNYFTAPQVVETSSTFPALRVTQTGTGPAIQVEDSGNPDATPFIVSTSGEVGIGLFPAAGLKLDVAGQIRSTDGVVDIRSIPLAASTAGLFGTVTNHDMVLITNNTERVRLNTSGSIGFSGLNYGTSGQVLTSSGSAAAPAWTSLGTAATLNVGTSANNVVQLDGTAKLPAVDGSQLTNLPATFSMPSGSVMPYAGATEPSGWLFCYGQAVSRTTYAALFAVLGTTYGAGDGSTTFNIPDIRGRVVAGQDDMGGTSANRLTNQSGGVDGDVLGAAGGAETHTLTTAQMPAHTHTVTTASSSGGSTSGLQTTNQGTSSGSSTSSSAGSGGAHNNVQPTLILNYIIKT